MSRIMVLVALVSSSISSARHPASRASMIAAACEVEPEASSVLKALVSLPPGSSAMKGEMSQHVTARPSSARTLVRLGARVRLGLG